MSDLSREEQIGIRQVQIMQRQISDLMTALARAEAINQQLLAEAQQASASAAASSAITGTVE